MVVYGKVREEEEEEEGEMKQGISETGGEDSII